MMHPLPRRALVLAAVVVAAGTPAGAAGLVQTGPADAAGAPVPPLVYRSLLAGFRPFDDAATKPWRQANDEAGAFGGWRAYAREAARPADPAPAASAPARKGAP